jgi:TolB-like protein/tetratricopeptide (TPR) repeat protein
LPFTDMSTQGDQAYFGDGIAEQLIDELTRLDGLRVASRTSSFGFRASRPDARSIGEALGVATILEGSVRKSGDTLRITAQLVSTDDGYHLWSNSFDRTMSDILAVQDEIAAAVAGALGVSLGVGDVNAFRGAGTSSMQAYEAYLRALRIPKWDQRTRLLERAVQLDPDYGAALAALGLSIAASQWFNPPQEAPAIRERAAQFVRRAVELDPESAYAYSLMATAIYGDFLWGESDRFYRKAVEIQPDGEILEHYGNMLMRTGRTSAALQSYEAAARAARHPIVGVGMLDIHAYLALERYDTLQRLIHDNELEPEINIDNVEYLVALNRGDLDTLKALFDKLIPQRGPIALHLAALRQDFDTPDRMIESLVALYEDESATWPSKYLDITLLAAFFGDPDLALDIFSREVRLTTVRYGSLWYPVLADMRKLPAFKRLMTDVKLVDYWREHGWPDHCRPIGNEDFECF